MACFRCIAGLDMRIKSNHGFVLFAVLIFLQIFSLLSVYAIKSLVIDNRQQMDQLQHLRLLAQGELVLRHLETQVEKDVDQCQGDSASDTALMRYPETWWREHACQGQGAGIRYYYRVERLEADACAYLKISDNSQSLAVQYYRITLLMVLSQRKPARLYLQSTVAVQGDMSGVCEQQRHAVNPGRQMWREF